MVNMLDSMGAMEDNEFHILILDYIYEIFMGYFFGSIGVFDNWRHINAQPKYGAK
ncbi:hypothetical protein [Sphingorhabdus lutea]|uniref:hypothetical protein n=1 Tax=Sphingorhabdus lutea TaxID=1913578 RepID=UPI001E4FBB13|nr:hypothetical protein [Sphingorhabdus lutea]